MEWISVKDRLPENEGAYVVRCRYCKTEETSYFDGKQFLNYDGYEVTEWLDENPQTNQHETTTVKLPSGEFLIVEVPEGAFGIFINNVGCLRFTTNSGRFERSQCIEPEQLGVYLDKDSWQLLGADPTNLTEEEVIEIVESKIHPIIAKVLYKDYMIRDYWVTNYRTSLNSLAASSGISKPYVILKLKNIEK